MARPIRSIDIYVPLDYNNGQPIEDAKHVALQRELLQRFDGVTSTQRQFPLQGLWHSGIEVYQDLVVVFAVMDFKEQTQLEVLRYLGRLKERLKKKFAQLDILITVQEMLAI
jgi:hypothetical protein